MVNLEPMINHCAVWRLLHMVTVDINQDSLMKYSTQVGVTKIYVALAFGLSCVVNIAFQFCHLSFNLACGVC